MSLHTAMKTLLLLASLLLLAVARPGERPSYHGAQVLRVVPHLQAQVTYLHGLMLQDRYDFWKEPRSVGSSVDILATAFHLPELKAILKRLELEPRVIISNVGALMKAQEVERGFLIGQGSGGSQSDRSMDWTAYHDYDVIDEWVDSLAKDYPNLCTVENVGTSYEGRSLKLLTIGKGGSSKPAIFIDGGIHAREWISPATVTYMVNELLTNSATYDDILSNVNFYVMPTINPDGYAYTHSYDRMWRKTRSDTDSVFGCKGADPNRNWGFHWNEVGASSNPCSDIYAGPNAFSEVEMQAVRDQINKYASQIKVYLTFHSYSQLWMYPWGYTSDLPNDWTELDSLAQDAVTALTAVHGTRYEIGSSTNTIYAAAGGSDDWAKGVAGVKYAYTVELRDTGNYGFILPPSQIIPSGEETFEALKVVANFVKNNYR